MADNRSVARSHNRHLLLLFLTLLPLFFGRLSDLPLPKWDDLTHAAIGKEILTTGDWFTMHANSEPIWIKPPLYFWIEAAFFSIGGATEHGARLPSALCGYLCVILTYLLARDLFGRRAAFLAILVFSTSYFFVKYSRRAMIDVPVAMVTAFGAWALVRAEARQRYFALYGLAIAAGYYFKAIQGLYLVPIGPAYLVFSGQARRLLSPWFIGSYAIAAALIAPWAVPQAMVNGAGFLLSQSAFGPLLSQGLTDAPARLLEPFRVLLGAFLPWLPFSVLGLVMLSRQRPAKRGTALLLCWIIVVMAMLCASRSFFQRYLLPVFPALVIAAAVGVSALLPRHWFSRLYRNAWMGAGTAVILLQILPIPLDNRGTDQIGVFRTMPYLTKPSDEIVLYKGNRWTVGQGLSFYADRRLSRQFSDSREFTMFLATARHSVFGVASGRDYEELKGLLGAALIERARPGGYVIFQGSPPPQGDKTAASR